jgi:hypothetical protein
LVAFSIGSAGCYLRPPKTSGPQESAQHVRVSVVGVDCDDDLDDGDVEITAHLSVKLKVENPTPQPLELTPAKLSLLSGGKTPSSAMGEDAITVAAGQSSVVPLRFPDINGCAKGFELSFEDAVTSNETPVEIASLRFTD